MRLLRFAVGLVAWSGLVSGCHVSQTWHGNHGASEGGSGGASSTGEGGDLFTGSGGAAALCDGVCAGIGPDGFEESPSLMWIGPSSEVPPCPEIAPLAGFEGFADLHVAPHACAACSCSPASCALPEAMHASAAKCAGAGNAASTEWDAPLAWEGACTADDAIPAALACGGMPCVQSLTIDAPTVEPCDAVTGAAVVLPQTAWGTIARECRITASDTCPIEGQVCAPAPPEGFALCVYFKGDDALFACPADYPDRHVVYAGSIDARACTPCACGQAEGAACEAMVSVFKDAACGQWLGSHLVTTATDDTCFDLPPGVALGSKSATWMLDEPGSCPPSGGEPLGEVEPSGAMTYCCQPGLAPAE